MAGPETHATGAEGPRLVPRRVADAFFPTAAAVRLVDIAELNSAELWSVHGIARRAWEGLAPAFEAEHLRIFKNTTMAFRCIFSRRIRRVVPGLGLCRSGIGRRTMATSQPAILDRKMGEHQWYLHMRRNKDCDPTLLRAALGEIRDAAATAPDASLVVGLGPDMLWSLTGLDLGEDFQNYPKSYASNDGSGREAIGTQEDLLLWYTSPRKDRVWKLQHDARKLMRPDMAVARETFTFMTPSFDWDDMTGFIDGTGNPTPPERDSAVAIVPDGEPGEGGSYIIAQRWVHDLDLFHSLSLEEQEGVFGRTKRDSTKLARIAPHSHLAHVELTEGETGSFPDAKKRDEITRRSTPYAFHDGTVGLYFMAFCARQAPFRERMEAMYGINGQVRDRLTDYSNPASGSFYFAPSLEVLDAL